MISRIFSELIAKYTDDPALKLKSWVEIEKAYSSAGRYYHNINHLEFLLSQLEKVKDRILNWDTVLFTLFYHDIIYHPTESDNEMKSAAFAEVRMHQLNLPNETILACKQQIIATSAHIFSEDNDTNYFTDADLSILGQSWSIYREYFLNVRKEYAVFPDALYVPGRRKVLQHFLSMNRIFKTTFFYDELEVNARNNLQREIDLLNNIAI